MDPQDTIQAEYAVTGDREAPGSPFDEASGRGDRTVLLEFALYILLNMACAALGLLIWIV